MKCIVVYTVVLLIVLVTLSYGQRVSQAELSDNKLVTRSIHCVLDKGPCDRKGAQLKAALPEVIKFNCKKCTPEQKATSRKLIAFAEQRYPREWAQIKAKYNG